MSNRKINNLVPSAECAPRPLARGEPCDTARDAPAMDKEKEEECDALQDQHDRRINPYKEIETLRAEVEILRRANPEMGEDEVLFVNMVEGSTHLDDLIAEMVRIYFDKTVMSNGLQDRAAIFERQAKSWKNWITKARAVGHITEKQVYPEGTIFQSRQPDNLIYDEETIPRDYLTVDEPKLRQAIKAGIKVGDARLIASNEQPRTTIRIK